MFFYVPLFARASFISFHSFTNEYDLSSLLLWLARCLKYFTLGHSFVKCLSQDISKGSNTLLDSSFRLVGTAVVRLAGLGGRTVDKLRYFDLDIITATGPTLLF